MPASFYAQPRDQNRKDHHTPPSPTANLVQQSHPERLAANPHEMRPSPASLYLNLLLLESLMGAQGQLNLWADRKLVARIIESIPSNGKDYSSLKCPRQRPDITQHIPPQLFLVLNGHILQEVYDKILHSVHRPLPPQIEIIRLKWRAGLERLTYNISMVSLNKTLLFDPLLNVANYGIIPAMESDVQITLACTGKMTGFAAFKLHLDIRREFEGLRKIPRIDFVAQKYCLSKQRFKKFHIKCDCRAQCQKLFPPAYFSKAYRKKCNQRCRRDLNSKRGTSRYNYYFHQNQRQHN
ncbi:Protein shifted [Taenia solium]|eukprot:TsM_000866900 transcript=TsM_000866900 gene=TsM_000866900